VKGASKEDLAQWVSLTFKKALTTTSICKGFSTIGIWPLNPNVMAGKIQPSKAFVDNEPQT
jgi:hypothetical protein